MTPARLQTIEEIFHSALAQRPDEIGAFLDTACAGDALLRVKVETLLASHERADRFIETSAVSLAAKILENALPDVLVGQRIGHYELLKRIGAGGMGEVYLATDITAGRKAALKLLPTRFTGDAERLKRFAREAHAVVGLNHPNILTIYEIGEDRSTHYIASELIDGETLRQRLERGPMEAEEAVDVAIQVAGALVAAHDAGIIHRDIKPENIMLRPDGYVKVLDFGIAKLAEPEGPATMTEEEVVESGRAEARPSETRLGSIFGTARYMSPEQVLGEAVDKRTDLWSLGVVFYEMVAGRAPFSGETAAEMMTSILETEPPPLASYNGQIPDELQQIIGKTLRKKSAERYQRANELSEALKAARRRMELSAASQPLLATSSSPRWIGVAAALTLVVLGVSLALPFYWRRNPGNSLPQPDKSIAVLPFENLSDGKENDSFAAGIQDDILTGLAKIHDLKVISRTSVMPYQRPSRGNVREIGRDLGVANLLEGSVRRTGNRILVNVQLIDARNDQHLWAERYDRTVADSIGLQGELAMQIAAALKATLAPEEKGRLGIDPTTNSEAYVLYLTALGNEREDEIASEQLYVRATTIDPRFALAYARASILNSDIAIEQELPARKEKARVQAEQALRLSPNLGEAHLALGLCLYLGDKDYNAALREFELAAASSPNNGEIYMYVGGIYRRQGRWREAIVSYDRALSLDPRNTIVVFHAALNHLVMRDWTAAAVGFARVVEINSDAVGSKIGLAYLEVIRNEQLPAARNILQDIPPAHNAEGIVALARWDLAMLERDYATAERILTDFPSEDLFESGCTPKTFYQGRTALARGDIESAKRYFAAALPVLEGSTRTHPDDPDRHAALGLLYAYMQRKEDAIREGHRAVELEPESLDAFHGAAWAANLALVYALTGEQDLAITLIERLLTTPGAVGVSADHSSNVTLADLRLRREWDSLRSNPRFQKILAGPEPKTVYE
ncbi:MAG: protein kinase [Candidatus Acidiferrum sp.]